MKHLQYLFYFRGRRGHDLWIYNYLCNQCISPLKLLLWIPLMARCTLYNFVIVCQWLAAGRWISPGTDVSSTII